MVPLVVESAYGVFSLQSEASDNKHELDLRGSKLASFDEVRELWTQGKLNWTTELRNTTAGGRGAVGRLTDRCNMIQYDDPTRIKHKQIRNDLETAWKLSWPHQTSPIVSSRFGCIIVIANPARCPRPEWIGYTWVDRIPCCWLHNTGISCRLWVLWPGPSINHPAWLWRWSLARRDVRVPCWILWKRNRLHTMQRHFVQWRLQPAILHPLSCVRDAHGSSCKEPSSLQVSKGQWTRGRCVWLRYIAGARGRWRVCPLQGAEPELLRAGHGSQECACSRWLCAIGCWVGTAGLHVMWVYFCACLARCNFNFVLGARKLLLITASNMCTASW